MNKPVKTKLCWNCEGVVATTAENCPYCGVSVVPATLDGTPASFSPPYRMGTSQEMSVPRSLYSTEEASGRAEEAEAAPPEEKPLSPSLAGFKTTLFCILFLLSGSTFLLFGTALALFSQNDLFVLQWDATYWFIYAGASLPLILIGWRLMNKLEAS